MCRRRARGIDARFSEADRRRILEETVHLGASLAEVARRYGIALRVLRRWKQELTPPAFITVEVTDVAVKRLAP